MRSLFCTWMTISGKLEGSKIEFGRVIAEGETSVRRFNVSRIPLG